jgi:CheY-like chemotaxis protein
MSLEISDDGPGFPPEIAARIFDPFFTTKPAGVGTGLGLSIVYGIVHDHGGEISVESNPNQGTSVRVELTSVSTPIRVLQEDAGQDRPGKPANILLRPISRPIHSASRPERILVIEDEPTVAQLISDVLSEEGFPVDTLLDSREGLDRVGDNRYALVICDLKMPHVDGPSIYRALQGQGSAMRHRLLFVTGDTMSAHTLEFLNSSGLPYLAKPFRVEELKQVVRQALADTPPDDELAAADWLVKSGRKK